ncbi:ABC transporter permease [Phenylobacterium sp.]|jgi:lipoprotein-releasing system permease protein|uniref:ABC transporter permease n=1 Tax=Phenylobacterium sp. TaxID=1871053 RepID=UPI0037CA98A5
MFAFAVARRYLLSSPLQTALLVAGVALGVTIFVFITALIHGLAVTLTDRVTADSAHVTLEPATRVARVLGAPGVDTEAVALVSTFQRHQIREWSSTVALVRQQDSVTAVSPRITGNAFLVKGEAVAPVSVTGVDPQALDAITPISTMLVGGKADLERGGLLIGYRLAADLGLSPGQPVLFRTDRGVERLLTVQGVFKTGVQALDERVTFLSIQAARPLFRLPEGVTNIEIKLTDPQSARPLAVFLQGATGLRAIPWQDRNLGLDEALTAQDQTGQLIQGFSLVSIIIGVASAMVLSTYRRRSEIGIMRAFGVSGGFVSQVFILQGLMIGLIGAVAGCVFGYGLCRVLAGLTRADGAPVLPITPEQGGYLAALILTTLGAVLASVAPARSAARLDPLKAIQQ